MWKSIECAGPQQQNGAASPVFMVPEMQLLFLISSTNLNMMRLLNIMHNTCMNEIWRLNTELFYAFFLQP